MGGNLILKTISIRFRNSNSQQLLNKPPCGEYRENVRTRKNTRGFHKYCEETCLQAALVLNLLLVLRFKGRYLAQSFLLYPVKRSSSNTNRCFFSQLYLFIDKLDLFSYIAKKVVCDKYSIICDTFLKPQSKRKLCPD